MYFNNFRVIFYLGHGKNTAQKKMGEHTPARPRLRKVGIEKS
jgi:hypothetical protein